MDAEIQVSQAGEGGSKTPTEATTPEKEKVK